MLKYSMTALSPEEITPEVRDIMEFALKFPCPTEEYPLHHIDSPGRIGRYVKKADEMAGLVPGGKVLDWGCGYGQMLLFLHNRGLDVTGCEFSEHYKNGTMADLTGIELDYLEEPVKLPYPDTSFDAVLSCGVLEHVPEPDGSVGEIHRVLKKGGYFFIYNLPNRLSWIEFASSRILHKGHERLYGLSEAVRLLESHGFKTTQRRYEDLLPFNLGFAGKGFRGLADKAFYSRLNGLLPKIPLLKYLCTNITLITRKG
jgi:ubiquinone/menaquinone biosynthesis C-methylase UbiE